jgi:hypothetical protein
MVDEISKFKKVFFWFQKSQKRRQGQGVREHGRRDQQIQNFFQKNPKRGDRGKFVGEHGRRDQQIQSSFFQNKIPKKSAPHTVVSHSKYTRALTFENW